MAKRNTSLIGEKPLETVEKAQLVETKGGFNYRLSRKYQFSLPCQGRETERGFVIYPGTSTYLLSVSPP